MKMNVGIIGAGTMGAGIAQVFAQAGCAVRLCDINLELAERGKKRIEEALMVRVEKGKLTQSEANETLECISTGTKEICTDTELIVEAAVESLSIKHQTFRELDEIAPEDCIFASNTSSLSITEIGAGIRHPVIGMHFFNPAPVMKLVEVISGENTPEAVKVSVTEIARSVGKVPVEVREAPGFVVNRILIPMINEAIGVYAEGTADAGAIDTAMQLGANHPMGPLALGDMIGLDVCLAIMEVLQSETGDPKYRPHPLLRKMVRAGKLGKKTGVGFYQY